MKEISEEHFLLDASQVCAFRRWLITLSNNQVFAASKRQANGIRRLLKWQLTPS